jgi:hypothetical protein
MQNVLEPEIFRNYLQEFVKLDEYSLSVGGRLDAVLGITYPPFPEGLQVGAMLFAFKHFPDCVGSEANKILLELRAEETAMGFLHFLKQRWPKALKKSRRLPSAYKPLGSWYEATYELCLQVTPYIPIKGFSGVDGAAFFHKCVKEIAMANGVCAMIDMFYPPNTKTDERQRERGGYNKRESGIYLNSLITRLSNGEKPTPPYGNAYGFFGTLLYYAVVAAEKDNTLRSKTFRAFIKATRDYVSFISGRNCATVRKINDGKVVASQGPKGPNKKLKTISTENTTFQELSVFYSSVPNSM